MTGKQLIAARAELGKMWGLDRPLRKSELGRAIRLQGRDPGASIHEMETRGTVTGPVSVAVQMMLAGAMPPDPLDAILTPTRASRLRNGQLL